MRSSAFICYSHQDKKWLKKLIKILGPSKREGLKVWCDEDIKPGSTWAKDIRAALADAKVAILLVSPDFLESRFIIENELPPLLDSANNGDLVILWIPVDHCDYKATPINNYQAARDPKRPLASLRGLSKQNEALLSIAEKIKEAMNGSLYGGISMLPIEQACPGATPVTTRKQSHAVALVVAPSGEDKGGLTCYRWKAFVRKTGESEYQEIPSGTIGAEATSTKDKLPELLQRLKTWIDSGLADVAILEIFASDDLLDEDWGAMSIRAGEDRSLHDYQPYLLRSLSRLINPEWNGRRGGPLKRMHDHLAQGTGAWLPHADLTNEKKLRMLDGDVYDPQRGEDVVSAICCPQTRVLNNRSNWLKSVLESMAPLVVCPSRQSPLAEEQVTACLRQLALNRVDGKVERPYCPDLSQLAKARSKWSDPTIDLRGLTILVDHPDRRPDPKTLQDFTQSSRPPEGGQPQPLAAPLISP